MILKKYLMIVLAFTLALAVYGCAQEAEETAETSQTEEVIVPLTRWQQEVKGEMFTLKFSDLKVVQTIDKSTKEVTATPSLKGNITMLNHSDHILDIKEVNLQYLDKSWEPIPFEAGGKKAEISFYGWSDIQPGKKEGISLDVKVPKAAMKEKATVIKKISYEVSYIPIPLKSEVLDISPKAKEK